MLLTEWNMEDALSVRYEEGINEGCERGEFRKTCKLYCQGRFSLAEAAEDSGLSTDAFLEKMKELCPDLKKS